MSYFETIVSSFLFITLLILSYYLLNSKFQEIRLSISRQFLNDVAYSYFDKLIFNNKEVYKDFYVYIFRVYSNVLGNQTVYINFSVNCNYKINLTTLKVLNVENVEFPFKIVDYELCHDGSLKNVNISIFLYNFTEAQILYIYLNSELGNLKIYNFDEEYKGATSTYIGVKKLKGIDLFSFYKIAHEYCEKRKEIEIEIFENDTLIFSCLLNRTTNNIFSFNIPILSLENKKLNVIFRIFE